MHNHIFYFKCFLQEAEEMHLKSVRIEGFHSEYSHMRRIFNTWQQNTYPSIMPVSEFHNERQTCVSGFQNKYKIPAYKKTFL